MDRVTLFIVLYVVVFFLVSDGQAGPGGFTYIPTNPFSATSITSGSVAALKFDVNFLYNTVTAGTWYNVVAARYNIYRVYFRARRQTNGQLVACRAYVHWSGREIHLDPVDGIGGFNTCWNI